MQVYTIYLDTETIKINADLIEIPFIDGQIIDQEIHRILNATGYEFFDYSDEIVILVDDQGLFKKGLPVFEIESVYGDVNKLAGKLLFVRNVDNEYSVDIGSITTKDIVNLREELKIRFVGFTKGVK